MPSGARNFFGRVVDRILPGQNYDTNTGTYQNIGKGILGLGARLGATALAGPAVGALVGKGAGYLIDHTGKIGPVAAEGIPLTSNVDAGVPGYQVNQPQISANLGLGAQSPGNSWAGYTQGAGSINNFGNTQFGNGQATQPGQWSPSSVWGQQVAADQGSNLGFGNNVSAVTGGGSGSTGGGSGYTNSNRMVGIFGGRPAGESMLAIARRWASS